MKQMISKRVRIGMRAAMMLAVVMTMMFATTTEALAQTKYKITTDGNCEVYYYDNFERIVVTEAEAGKELSIWLKEDANPASGYYFTQEYTLNGTSLGSNQWGYNEGFTMPAKDVTIAAKQAKRETISFDLTTTTPQEMPSRAALQFSGDKRMWTLYNDELGGYDVNNSGVADVTYYDVNGEHIYVQRLAGSDASGTFSLTYSEPTYQYSTISFIFPEKKKIQVQSSWITVEVGEGLTYNGKKQTPAVTVKDGTKDITQHFDISYNNNVDAGEATVTVTAKTTSTDYTGSASKKFTIKPITGITVTITGKTYTGIYDGVEHVVEGYDIVFSNPICTAADIAFAGTDVASRIDAGTVNMGLAAEQFKNVNNNFDNVKFVVTDGFVTITPKSVTVTTGSATKEYDGTPLTCSETTIEGLVPGEKADVIAKGSQTDVGSCTNTYEIVWSSAKATNYVIVTENLGTLVVTPKSGNDSENPDPVKETKTETVTNADGSSTETSRTTVTDASGKLVSESITSTTTHTDGSQTITTSKTPETDANEIYSITADGKVTKINGGASSTPAIILNGIMSLDATENNNLITYPTLGSVDIETQPSILIAQGDVKNVLFNTTTEKNAQGQTTATSASMTVKETGGADGTGDTGPTKIAINTGGGDNGGGNSRYIITWQEDGTVILSETYAYGEMPIPPKPDPTKDDDDDYTYTFKGWTPSISLVTGNANYTAVFEATPKTGGDNGGGTGDDNAGDAPTSGTFGNLTWEVSKSDGSSVYDLLTISGSGPITTSNGCPWSDYITQIKTVIFSEGVTGIGENAFAGYTADHVYVTVPKGKALKVTIDNAEPVLIAPNDNGMADIIDYLFYGLSNRDKSRALTLKMEIDNYEDMKEGDTFTMTYEGAGQAPEKVNIPYKCYQTRGKNFLVLLSEAEMATLIRGKADKTLLEKAHNSTEIGLTVDAVLTAELVAGTNDTYRVTGNKATILTFTGVVSKDIANADTYLTRPDNISFEGADIDTSNIDFADGTYLKAHDQFYLVAYFGVKVGTITGSNFKIGSGKGEGHAVHSGCDLQYVLNTGTSDPNPSQESSARNSKDQAATTMTVNYETKKKTDGGAATEDVSGGKTDGERANANIVTISGADVSGSVYGGKSEKGEVNTNTADITGGKVNHIVGGGSRAASAEEEEENDEIEIVSGREYEILHDGFIVLNFYTPDADITVNSIVFRRPGDANNDGFVDAADLVEMINAKNGKASERFNLTNADIDRDGDITQEDIDAVVNMIMK